MSALEGRARLGPTAWLKTASVAAALTLAMTSQAWAQGTFNFAMTDEPPHLDVQVTTATLTTLVDMHILETLYTFNSNLEPVPLLAESETVSDDGKTVVITLRQGVPFHNGEEMLADDVVASLDRWGAHGGRGKVLYDHVESVEATGDHEVTITFKDVFGPWKNLLAFNNGGPAILPASIVAEATAEPLPPEQIIGTGPFSFSEWRPNRYIELVRFDDYAQPPGEADGYAGARDVTLDAIHFIAVPDVGTRVSGVQAGDYDYAELIPGDLYEELSNDDSVVTIRAGIPEFPLIFFNSSDGIFKDNYALRRAIMAALNHDEALRIAVGPEELWDAQRRDLSGRPVLVQRRRRRGLSLRRSRGGQAAGRGGRLQRRADPLHGLVLLPAAPRHRHGVRAADARTRASTSTSRSTTGRPWSTGAPSRASGTSSRPPMAPCRIRCSTPS